AVDVDGGEAAADLIGAARWPLLVPNGERSRGPRRVVPLRCSIGGRAAISGTPLKQSAPAQFLKHVKAVAPTPTLHQKAAAVAVTERQTPAVVEGAATPPSAALAPCVPEQLSDLGGAHGVPSMSLSSDGALTIVLRPRFFISTRRWAINL